MRIPILLLMLYCVNNLHAQQPIGQQLLKGSFVDDYGIRYSITDSVWTQLPRTKYNIIKWNTEEQYIIAQNDTTNKLDKGLYTRIDYMLFENMAPYTWGFCLTVYNAANAQKAEKATAADRKNPRKGCGGYPFSRMKKAE